jgi:alpha-D-ribose 1-methylphosphonate 5-triphosphate diphosphatase
MQESIYTNYRLLLPDQELLGTLVVRDGKIAEIQPGATRVGRDGEGDYLLPGLVELHTDNLEKCLAPRPRVRWNPEAAATYHDRDLASAGITTVCDAIAIGDVNPDSPRMSNFAPMIDLIQQGQTAGRFSIDHWIHLRCELGYDVVADVTEQYIRHPRLRLISLMDHTPGQRQFTRLGKFKTYYMGKHGLNAEQVDAFIADRLQAQQEFAPKNRAALVALAQTQQVPLASHDDTTIAQVEEAIQEGVVMAEFPTTLEAAKTAHAAGLKVLMGGPNLVLGESHSGNISALELVNLGLVDILSSDYVPQSLLHAAFLVTQQTGQPLDQSIRLVTDYPAQAIGLAGDRGTLEVGKRADLVRVHNDGIVPQIREVIRGDRRIA